MGVLLRSSRVTRIIRSFYVTHVTQPRELFYTNGPQSADQRN